MTLSTHLINNSYPLTKTHRPDDNAGYEQNKKNKKNYRRRRVVRTTIGTLLDLLEKHPPETPLENIYKQLFEELILLENNKEN